jgi:hypothetical protein
MATINYLVLTRPGYEALGQQELVPGRTRLWINEGILDDEAIAHCESLSVELRVLPHTVDPGRQGEVATAIEAIEAEFPDEEVMAEYR